MLHNEIGKPVLDDLFQPLRAAKIVNEGFTTVEYTAYILFDMAVHSPSLSMMIILS